MFCGIDITPHNIAHIRTKCGEYFVENCQSVPHNIVMELNNFMGCHKSEAMIQYLASCLEITT